ncbi:MAG: acyl-CoA dehydrogenase family protein [Pseudomonadota bacterium]
MLHRDERIADVMRGARSMRSMLFERADELEEVRRLPADIARQMAEIGVFRLVTPESVGGLEASPRQIFETVEELAKGTASAGWCAMIASTTALNAAYMPLDQAKEIYSAPETITGGVFAPMGKAVVEGDGYRVSGRWQWGSGSANCNWLCGGCMIFEDGEMRRTESGAPENRMMIFPADEAELVDTWHVAGLKGTGSGDIEVKEIFVPKSRSVSLMSDEPREQGPLYLFPAFGLLALGVASVAIGNAAGALDSFKELAVKKANQGSSKTLSERAVIQSEYSKAVAAWKSARAYLLDEIDTIWANVSEGNELTFEARVDLRLACTNATRTCAEVCRTLYDYGGGAALFLNNDLQRRLRDAHAMTQHIVTAPASYELLGRSLFGHPVNAAMI